MPRAPGVFPGVGEDGACWCGYGHCLVVRGALLGSRTATPGLVSWWVASGSRPAGLASFGGFGVAGCGVVV